MKAMIKVYESREGVEIKSRKVIHMKPLIVNFDRYFTVEQFFFRLTSYPWYALDKFKILVINGANFSSEHDKIAREVASVLSF